MSKKYWGKKADTTDKKETWQEPFPRETSVPATSIQALDTLLGFSGSWFGSIADRYSSYVTNTEISGSGKARTVEPSNPKWRVSNLGSDGYPEINFVPYNFRTNVMGSKGGALLGHPISFSVVGPTQKSIDSNLWEWEVTNGLTLTLSSLGGITLTDIYGNLAQLISEGLYLVLTETGADRKHLAVNKTYENLFNDANFEGIYPKEEYGESAHYEIFRVLAADNATGTITLAPNKPIDKYFVIPANNPAVKSVMFFKPYVTRLVAVPESGDKGYEKKFLVVSPEYAAHSDLHEMASNVLPNTQGSLVDGQALTSAERGQKLPIPIPTKNLSGKLESNAFGNTTSKLDGAGVFRLYDVPTGHGLLGGEIIHITEVDARLFPVSATVNQKPNPNEEDIGFNSNALLGWFEVIETGADMLQLRREKEVDISTGKPYFGHNLYLDQANTDLKPSSEIFVKFTAHEPVSKIFEGDYNADKVEACRLTNLIDPNWVDRTTKQVSDDAAGTLHAGSPAKADRAIFTTNSGSNGVSDAGSLLDLGFRMVLFPAKNDGGNAVPDFDNPIASNEVIINSSLSEKQTIDIDYSAGVVTLSHPPIYGAGGSSTSQITPHGIVGQAGNNPRGEVVLFAACVPYSMERGQTGTGISVMGGSLSSADFGDDEVLYASALGEKVAIESFLYDPANPYFIRVRSNAPLPPKGKLQRINPSWNNNQHPNNYSSHSTRNYKETGDTHQNYGDIIGYTGIAHEGKVATDNGIGYVYFLDGLYHDTLTQPLDSNQRFVLRKQSIRFVDLADDTTFGSAYRSDTLRFAYADLSVNVDGSITVMPTAVAGPAQELRGLFPLKNESNNNMLLEGGRVAFDRSKNRWVIDSPPYLPSATNQIGLEITRGKAYVSDWLEKENVPVRPLVLRAIERSYSNVPQNSDTYSFHIQGEPESVRMLAQLSDERLAKIHALFKAETVISQNKDWANETADNHRLVVAFRNYDGTDSRMEAPNNPINWIGIPVPNGADKNAIASLINSGVSLLNISMGLTGGKRYGQRYPVADVWADQDRVSITERSVEIMPSLSYLISNPINAVTPFQATAADSMVVTIRSADPRFPNNWCTFVLPADDAFTSSDPIEVAAYLNMPLYDRNSNNYVGHRLEQAGFVRGTVVHNPHLVSGAAVGVVPALDALDTGLERQILFAAHDDIRHPAHDFNTGTGDPTHPDYEKVILVCSGTGSALRENLPTQVNNVHEFSKTHTSATTGDDHFHNVLVEIAHWKDGDSSLAQRLGGSFRTLYPNSSVVRCGLFHHTGVGSQNSHDAGAYDAIPNSPDGYQEPRKMNAKFGGYFETFDEGYGTISSAYFLGSLRIDNVAITGPYTGILTATDMRTKGLKNQDRKSVITATGVDTTPNLSSWTEHRKETPALNLINANLGGNYALWFSVTNQVIEGYEFKENFTSTKQPSTIPQIYRLDWTSENRFTQDKVDVTGDSVFLNSDNTYKLGGISLIDTYCVLLQETENIWYNGNQSFEDHINTGFDPFDGASEIINNGNYTGNCFGFPTAGQTYDVQFLPNTSRLQTDRSTAFVRNKTNSNIKNENIDQPNTTYIMGGHIDLLASAGDNNLSGITLGTTVPVGAGQGEFATFMSFIEHGVFRNLYSKSHTSDPFFSNKFSGNALPKGVGNVNKGIFGEKEGNLHVAGVAGVRFSGDTNIWLKNLQKVGSGGARTAAIIPTYKNVANSLNTGYESEIGTPLSELEARLAGVTYGGDKIYGAHKPHTLSGGLGRTGFAKQEGIVLLGMTRKDYTAWKRFCGLEGPLAISQNHDDLVFGNDIFGMPREFTNTATLHDISITKNLEGMYLELSLGYPHTPPDIYEDFAFPDSQTNSESPALKIVSAPITVSPQYFLDDQHTARHIEKNAVGVSSSGKSGGFGKDFVAIVAIKVEWVAPQSKSLKPTKLIYSGVNGNDMGYSWQMYSDAECVDPIAMAEVVETGGYPTGLTNTLTGLSIDPTEFGKKHLDISIVFDNSPNSTQNTLTNCRLLGVTPVLDRKGSPKSIAYITVPKDGYNFDNPHLSYRAILKAEEAIFVDDYTYGDWQDRNFSVDEDGFVQYRQKRRLGLGVVIDGGLGVVHAKGFRANPRPIRKINYGSLQVFGSSSYPFANYNSKKSPIHLASVMDTTEFIDDVFIASPKGAIIFEDARAAQGLAARLKENAVVIHSGLENQEGAYYNAFTNDALFPYNVGGILFRGTGSVKYERGYSALSATPVNPILSGFLGRGENSGIKGAGVANYGTCLLLPKGPTNVSASAKTNWGDGDPNAPSLSLSSPLDVPLYEWTNGVAKHRFAFSVTGCFYDFAMLKSQELDVGGASSPHKVNPGLLHQGSRKAWSRGDAPYSMPESFRVSEGMIVENISNGTFHTVGEIGRRWIEFQYRSADWENSVGFTSLLGEDDRPANQGSRVLAVDYNNPEQNSLFYDLNPYFGFKHSWADPCLGGGDRTDMFTDVSINGNSTLDPAVHGTLRTHIRNSVAGHRLRLTPNVEFVPVLGKHNVDGGLLPPLSKNNINGQPTPLPSRDGAYIENADAIFYSMRHNFKPAGGTYGAGDIGKFLYICGTDVYQYTGWWVIIDVIQDYKINEASLINNEVTEFSRDVAVLRKWKRDDIRAGEAPSGRGALPLMKRAPYLRMTSSNLLKEETGFANDEWFDKNNCSDITIAINQSNTGNLLNMVIPQAVINGAADMYDLVQILNADPDYNGTNLKGALAGHTATPFIKWIFEGNREGGHGGKYGTIAVTYDLSQMDDTDKYVFLGHDATLYAHFQSKVGSSTTQLHDLTTNELIGQCGFFSYQGINSSVDRGAGDRNNAAPMAGTAEHATWSAARGLRWVESHPLTEENVGSYMHLRKPHTHFFNHDTQGLQSRGDENLAPAWISRYPQRTDAQITNTSKVDIFRLNRCPTTKDIVVGGDCEVHYRELVGSTNDYRGFIYSPLGIDYGFWQETTSGMYLVVNLYDHTAASLYQSTPEQRPTEYALQPIAREKIVKVNPSSGKSNVITDLANRTGISYFSHFDDGAGNRTEHQYNIRLYRTNPAASDTHPASFVPENLSVGQAIVLRTMDEINVDPDNGGGANWSGGASLEGKVAYILDVSYQNFIPGHITPQFTGVITLIVYIPDFNEPISTAGGGGTVFHFSNQNAYFAVAEGIRPFQVGGTDASQPFKLRSANDLAIDLNVANGLFRPNAKVTPAATVYQWTPASEWWEVLNPAVYYNRVNESPTGSGSKVFLDGAGFPATLKVDLTEAYTQAQQTGAGIGSPYQQKRPRGARLNRIWVNFGLWGNPCTGHNDIATHTHDSTPCFLGAGDDPMRYQSLTFNLKVEIPSDQDNFKLKNAGGLLPFGGRAPTASASATHHIAKGNKALQTQNVKSQVFTIPLYVNREAGDISPNIQDRFLSSGPMSGHTHTDWVGGDPELGFGIGTDPTEASTWRDIAWANTPSGVEHLGNSATVTLWGGMDFYAFVDKGLANGLRNNALCMVSQHPRQSVIGLNPYMGSNGKDLQPLTEHFKVANNEIARSLNLAAMTGITVCHTAAYAPPPKLSLTLDPVKGSAPIYNLSSHSFTIALTPIGDSIEGPKVDYSAPATFVDSNSAFGKYGWQLQTEDNRPFKVGNWLDAIKDNFGTNTSGSMLPTGARVWLEITVPQTRRYYPHSGEVHTSNGAWVGQILCSFDVETADGTAYSRNVNLLGDE